MATVINWNVGWARSTSRRGVEILRRIESHKPHVVCVTEGHTDFLPRQGFVICSHPDYGYSAPTTRRKVLLWSHHPWHDVDERGDETLPTGRFVAGSTHTDQGMMRFVGVCVPWKDAHVRTGRKDRRPWEDHISYLLGLAAYLKRAPVSELTVLGDFNQTLPRRAASAEACAALSAVCDLGLNATTMGLCGDCGRLTIDHVLVGARIRASSVETISSDSADGPLSDHFGIKAILVPDLAA